MTVKELCTTLGLTAFSLPCPDRPVRGGYSGDLLSWVMGKAPADGAWLTIMSNANVCAVAVLADTACIILTEGVSPDPDLLTRCEVQGVNLLGASDGTFHVAARLSTLL